MIALQHYLVVSAALFCLGLLAVLTRRNAVNVLMGLELILNAANLNWSPSRASARAGSAGSCSQSS